MTSFFFCWNWLEKRVALRGILCPLYSSVKLETDQSLQVFMFPKAVHPLGKLTLFILSREDVTSSEGILSILCTFQRKKKRGKESAWLHSVSYFMHFKNVLLSVPGLLRGAGERVMQ